MKQVISPYIKSMISSPNLGKKENRRLLNNFIDSHTPLDVEELFLLLTNSSLDDEYIENVLNDLDEMTMFDLIYIAELPKYASNKLIKIFINSNNDLVNKYIPNFLIRKSLDKKLLKKLYNYYSVIPILFSKEELIYNLIENKPEIILECLFDPLEDKISNDKFDYICKLENPLFASVINKTWLECRYSHIHNSIIGNKNLSSEQIQHFLDKKNTILDYEIAKNSSLSEDQIQYLLDKKIPCIDMLLISCTFLSEKQKYYLANKNDYTNLTSLERINLSSNTIIPNVISNSCKPIFTENQIDLFLNKNISYINSKIAENPCLSKRKINFLLSKNDYKLDCHLGANKSLSQDQIQDLLDKNSFNIDISVSTNTSLSNRQINYLLEKNEYIIDIRLAHNESLSIEQSVKLIHYKPSTLKKHLSKIVGQS